jgi:hypothetical protein
MRLGAFFLRSQPFFEEECAGIREKVVTLRLIIQLKYVIDMSENQKQVEKERKGVLELLLKKTGLKYKELVDAQVGMWMAGNLDLLTAEEKKQFPHLVF